jgi:hypothetical protein
MSRTTVTYKKTGKTFPKKSDRHKKSAKIGSKFMGFRSGDRDGDPHAKKGVDFVNYGYPFDIRHVSVVKQHIQDEVTKEELKDINQNKDDHDK